MIKVSNGCEYTVLIADLIEDLSNREDDWVMDVWLCNNDLPIPISSNNSVLFLQEGMKIVDNGFTRYIFYDTIDSISIMGGVSA